MNKLTSRLSIPLLALFSAFALSGCAAMFSGGSQKVVFTAPQPQSSVTVEEKQYALPATVKISKKTTTATFTNPKYSSKELAWKRDFQVGFLFMDISSLRVTGSSVSSSIAVRPPG